MQAKEQSSKSAEFLEKKRGGLSSFSAVCTLWKRDIEPAVKESTFQRYGYLLDHYILPQFGERRIGEITLEDMRSFLCSLQTDPQHPLSEKSVSDIKSLCSQIFKFAAERGEEVNCNLSQLRLRRQTPKNSVFTDTEQKKLMDYLKKQTDLTSAAVLLTLFTGIRLGELCALKVGDFNLEEQTLFIHGTLIRIADSRSMTRRTKLVCTSPKSDSSIRVIPLPDFLLPHLQPYLHVPSESYFLSQSGEKMPDPRTMENRYYKILHEAGLPRKNFHTLRHTFATRCVELDFDIKSLSTILGHSDITITMNRYVHPSMEHQRSNMNKLGSLYVKEICSMYERYENMNKNFSYYI